MSLLSGPGDLAKHATQIEGVTTRVVPMGRSISLLSDLAALLRICGWLRRLKPDIVEFGTPKAGLLGCIAAWLCRIRVRVYFLRGLRLETETGFKRRVLMWAERAASSCAHATLCNSSSLRERAISMGIAESSKLVLLRDGSSNGVDVTRFSPGGSDVRPRLGIPGTAPVIGFVGRLTADKGVPELLEAFAMILRQRAEARLLLVGWFDAAEDALGLGLRRRIEGHPGIVHTGYIADTAPYYRAMDLLVLPSWREGFPNVVLEAAASGVPVIAADSTGSRDAVVQGVTGFLIPPGDPGAISKAAVKLIDDPTLRERMSGAARRWALDHYDHRQVMSLTVRFYQSLLSSNSIKAAAGKRAEELSGLSASL